MKKTPKNIPSPYKFPGTPIFRDTTALPFADGGPLHDRDINSKLLQSTYASALGNMFREGGPFGEDQGVFDYATSIYASQPGNYYRTGGQFPRPYSLPEDSFKQGGTNLHNSVYASSSAPYPGIYADGGPLLPPDNAPAGTPFNLANRNSWMGNYGMIPQGHNLSLPLTSLPGIGNQITSGAATANFKTVGDYVSAAENWERNQAGSPIAPGPVNINAVIPSTPPIPEVAKTNYYTDPYTGQVVKDFNPATGVATPREIPNSFGNTQYSSYLEKVANSPVAKENQQAINSERLSNMELLKTMTPEQKAAMRAAGLTPTQYLADPFSAGATKFAKGGKLVVAGEEKHKIYKKTSPTGNGEGMEGHIMVNHPTMDKGQWDTIDLTTKAGAKTVAEGIAATKQWHKENPNVYRDGGSVFYASNTPQLEGEGKDLTYPDGAYVYGRGGVIKTSQLFAGGGPIYPTNQQLAQFLNPEYQRVTQGQEVTVRPNAYQMQQAKNKAAGINKYDAINIKPQVAESTKPNIAPVDKKVLDKVLAQKTAERKVVAKEIKNSPLLTQEQKQEILMSPQKLDENAHLAYQKNPDVLKAAKEYTAADKATNILRNPLVAASYFMKPGAFNMPMNYSELERSPNYSDETWNRNAVGQGLNAASYFNPAGLALHMADNALYTGTDLDKALESGKTEDWKQAGLSAANTALDLVSSRYIGGSGRLLNAGEQATLNAMNTSNRLGLNPSVNNFLSTRVFPNINSSVVRSADDIAAARLVPQINPNNINYNPLARNLYNNAVTAGNVQNTLEATKASKNNPGIPLTDFITDAATFGDQLLGNVFRNKTNKKAIEEGNQWLKQWIDNPVTQAKMLEDWRPYTQRIGNRYKDDYDLGLEQARTFVPNSKEYSLTKQLEELTRGKRNVHSDESGFNAGVSYLHYDTPYKRAGMINEVSGPRDNNSWISRSTLIPQNLRKSVTIHEGTHDWTSDFLLNNSNQTPDILNTLSPKVRKIQQEWKTLSREGKDPSQVMGKSKSYLGYLANPTEVQARIMQLRNHFNLTPEASLNLTKKEAQQIMDDIKALPVRKRPINEKFFDVVDNDPEKLKYLFNRLWMAAPIVGGSYLGNELLQNNGSDQNSSGQFKMGGQARVIKSSQLFNR